MAEEWSQHLMTLSDFIDSVIEAPCGPAKSLGYLAQHPLFDQIPALRADILVPDYTALGSDADVRSCACGGSCKWSDACHQFEVPIRINAWFGPAGTVSPLHIDATHNLLSQVVKEPRAAQVNPGRSACRSLVRSNSFCLPHPTRILCTPTKAS